MAVFKQGHAKTSLRPSEPKVHAKMLPSTGVVTPAGLTRLSGHVNQRLQIGLQASRLLDTNWPNSAGSAAAWGQGKQYGGPGGSR